EHGIGGRPGGPGGGTGEGEELCGHKAAETGGRDHRASRPRQWEPKFPESIDSLHLVAPLLLAAASHRPSTLRRRTRCPKLGQGRKTNFRDFPVNVRRGSS